MVEFRLYYDDKGDIVCYSCEDLPGNYLVINKQTYAIGNPFLKVINGELVNHSNYTVISRLKQSTQGIKCAKEDVCILADNNFIYWETEINEYRNS